MVEFFAELKSESRIGFALVTAEVADSSREGMSHKVNQHTDFDLCDLFELLSLH